MGQDVQQFAGISWLNSQQIFKSLHAGILQFIEEGATEEMVGRNPTLNFAPEMRMGSRVDFLIVDGDGLINNKPGGVHERGGLSPRLEEAGPGGQKKVHVVAGGESHHELHRGLNENVRKRC